MKKISEESKLLSGVLDLIARHFGENVEVVLHAVALYGALHAQEHL